MLAMSGGELPLPIAPTENGLGAMFDLCFETLQRLRLYDRHLSTTVGLLLEDAIPGLSIFMATQLAASCDPLERQRAASRLPTLFALDRELGFDLASALLDDQANVAMAAADYLVFAAESNAIETADLRALRTMHDHAWWPDAMRQETRAKDEGAEA